MSDGTLKKRLPKLLSPRKLAGNGAKFHGFLFAEDLPRLVEACHAVTEVEARLHFFFNEENKRVLQGALTAKLELVCQRCLESLPSTFEIDMDLMMVWDEDQAKALPKTVEPWIVGDGEEDVHSVIEEELLLALPVVAFHEENCIDPDMLSVGESVATDGDDTRNPFAALAQLKTKKD